MKKNKTFGYRYFMKLRFLFVLVLFFKAVFFFQSVLCAKELNIAWSSLPHTYDPRYATDANSQYLEGLLHCSLITFDSQGNIENQLARSIEWKNSTTLQIKLDKGFKFSDGKVVTLQDVKASYNFFVRSNQSKQTHSSPRAIAFRNITKLEIVGDTLVFFLKKADASFISNLIVGILPQKISAGGLIDKSTKVTGCGPFIHKHSSLNEIALERNPYHLDSKEKKKISIIKIKIVKDETTRFSKLRKGEVDIVQNGISYQKVVSLNMYPELKLLKGKALKTSYLGFNFKNSILKQTKVRQALAHAINKKAIIKYVLKDLASEAYSLLPEQSLYSFAGGDNYSYDLKKAQKILDLAGFKLQKSKKHRFELTLTLTNNPTRYAVAKVIASDLAKIGIKLKIKTLEWGKFKNDVEKGAVDLWLLSWIGFKDPDIYRYAFSSESFPPNGGNRGWFTNKKLDALFTQGLTTYDIPKRKKIYSQVQDLVTKELPYVFLYHDNNFAVVRKNVAKFELFADGRYSSLVHVEKL